MRSITIAVEMQDESAFQDKTMQEQIDFLLWACYTDPHDKVNIVVSKNGDINVDYFKDDDVVYAGTATANGENYVWQTRTDTR